MNQDYDEAERLQRIIEEMQTSRTLSSYMKPVTEQRQQELIALANVELTEWDLNSDHYALIEIALASLTAPVFMHGISDPDGKAYFSECCVDEDGGFVSDEVCALNGGETDVDGGYQAVKLYTAPPVPVIKLPSDKDFDEFFIAIESGGDPDWSEPEYLSKEWNQYLARRQLALGIFRFSNREIKRLNNREKE